MITNLEDQLRRDEDDRQFPYDDANGKTFVKGMALQGNLTIAIGINLNNGLFPEEREFLLANRIKRATGDLATNFPWALALDDARKGAMLNLIFNMGSAGLAKFVHFLAAMKSGDWPSAKAQLLDSAADHEEPARIGRLALQIETGIWQ